MSIDSKVWKKEAIKRGRAKEKKLEMDKERERVKKNDTRNRK
jgi:hypothetical protein